MRAITLCLLMLLAGCAPDSGGPALGEGCDGHCAGADGFLRAADVRQVLAAAVAEAKAQRVAGTIAVVDRVGNVLAVYRMTGAADTVTIAAPYARDGGLENLAFIPSTLAAVSKAVTAAHLSSEGNAFSTRTASQIVQQFFNPGEVGQPGGPLFGVQFSQLGCSDVSRRAGETGPQRAPLGLAADPGGFPLYRNGTPVGAVGVEIDGAYSFDDRIVDRDRAIDEVVALAAAGVFPAPPDRVAARITADGKNLRWSDADASDLLAAGTPAALRPGDGRLVSVPGYFSAAGGVQAGTAFTLPASGVRADAGLFPGRDAFVVVDGSNANRYPPRASADGRLTRADVLRLLDAGLATANRARAQIRRPLGTPARVSVAVTDRHGVILGLVRTRDAPVFGIDVAVQKARSAAFFSSPVAAAELRALPPADFLAPKLVGGVPQVAASQAIGDYVDALQADAGDATLLADAGTAFSARAIGNLARPYFPDGIIGTAPGALSRPIAEWSPFNTGLQLDLAYNQLIGHVAFAAGLAATDVARGCSGIARNTAAGTVDPLGNGLQIFPGGVPLYLDGRLVGAVGVSGDGVDQDDMVSFLAADALAANAPPHRRADRLQVRGSPLRYVQCPPTPFNDSDEQRVCDGR